MLNVYTSQVVFKEIPDKISLAFSITGCGGPCPYCHSPFLHQKENVDPMSLDMFRNCIEPYQGMIEVVLFLGGEWEEDLIDYLKLAKSLGFKTALYTELTLDKVDQALIDNLDYLKVGPYVQALGGLDKETTNQRLYEYSSKGVEDITYKFRRVRKEGF